MSTTETKAVPAGRWALDPVHSTIGFAVGYMAGTFTGGFSQFGPHGRRFQGIGEGRFGPVQRPGSCSPSPVARVLRRRALPAGCLRVERDRTHWQPDRIDGEITIKGRRSVYACRRMRQ